jgi:inorganic pyrophosphatase
LFLVRSAAEQSLPDSEVRTLADLDPKVLSQIEAFFVNYQRVRGIEFRILGRGGPKEARKILDKGTNRKKAA